MNLETLTEAATAWDGTLDAAVSLRAAARVTESPKGQPPSDLARVLARVVGMYRSGRQPTLDQLEDAADWRGYAPFLGDRFAAENGNARDPWPWEDIDQLDDDRAARWMAILGRPHVLTTEGLAALETLLETRPRTLWQPAALALARHAVRDPLALASLQRRWAFAFPNGLPKRWPSGEAGPPTPSQSDAHPKPTIHHLRHTLVAGCAFVAAGGAEPALTGFSVAGLVAIPLPVEDPTNASIVLKSLGLLATAATPHPNAGAALTKHLGAVPADKQCFDELKVLHAALGPASADLAAAIVERLSRPSYLEANHSRALEAACVWLDALTWLQGGVDPGRVVDLVALAGPMSRAATYVTGALAEDPGRQAAERLPRVLDADVRATTARLDLVASACELLQLFSDPSLAESPWPALARRADVVDPLAGATGSSTRVMGRVAVALALADSGMNTAFLLRDVRLDLASALVLAGRRNGAVVPQSAVQFERLIRETRVRPNAAGRERTAGHSANLDPATEAFAILWQLVRVDPLTEVFRQLEDQLRASATDIRALVRTFGGLDSARGQPDLAERYLECVDQATPWLEGGGPSGQNAAQILGSLAGAIRRLCTLPEVIGLDVWPEARLDAFGELLVGGTGFQGLDAWIAWWGVRQRDATETGSATQNDGSALRIAWAGLRSVVEETEGRMRLLTAQDAGRVREAIDRLRAALAPCVWPERDLVDRELRGLERWHSALVAAAEVGRVVSQQVMDRVIAGQLEAAVSVLEQPGRAKQLGAEAARALHAALLLARDWSRADHVRALVQKHIRLPPSEIAEAEDILARRDDMGCITYVKRRTDWAQHPPALVIRLHEFLLQTWNLNAAAMLRARTGHGEVELASTSQHIAPLLIGVASGPMIVADVASDWLELATLDAPEAYFATVALGLVGALALLLGECPAGRQPTLSGRLVNKLGRIAPTWSKALGVAAVASVGALALKPGGAWSDSKTLLLWTSLSLFLGTFLGVVAQGRRLAGKSE